MLRSMLRTLVPALLALTCLAFIPVLAVPSLGAEGEDEEVAADAAADAAAEVIALLERQGEDWNRGDLEAFTTVYAQDAVFLSPSGVHQGRAEVLARYQNRYPDRAAMGTLSFEVIETRVAADASMVTLAAHWNLAYPEESDREDASGLTLLVLQRGPDGWKIAQDASM